MQVTVSGRHMGVTESLQKYCQEKAERLPRYLDRIQLIEVVFDGKAGVHTAELIVHAAGAPQPFVAREQDEDIYAAVDLVLDKIVEQLRRYKEKHRNRKHPPRASTEPPPVPGE